MESEKLAPPIEFFTLVISDEKYNWMVKLKPTGELIINDENNNLNEAARIFFNHLKYWNIKSNIGIESKLEKLKKLVYNNHDLNPELLKEIDKVFNE